MMLPLPDTLTETMLSYAKTRNIYALCRDLVEENSLRGGGSDTHLSGALMFHIKHPFGQDMTNMHWISPADDATQQDMLRHLGVGGFGDVLQQFGDYFPYIMKLVCYQLSFLVVSQCFLKRPHADLSGNGSTAWNVLFPLVLVEESGDELVVYSDNKKVSATVKYELGTAVVLGDGGIHATNEVNYSSGSFRLMASVYVADICKLNVQQLLTDVSQKYPKSVKLLSEMAEKPHWSRQLGLNMPTIPVADRVGRDWYRSFEKLKVYKETVGHVFITPHEDYALSEWAYRQRFYAHLMRSGQPCFGMTPERHRLLASIGFKWSSDRKAMKYGVTWETRYNELVDFHKTHGNCNVKPSHRMPVLCSWVRNQRRFLRQFKANSAKPMSDLDVARAEKLDRLGIRWSGR
jgi:hypothetical protein